MKLLKKDELDVTALRGVPSALLFQKRVNIFQHSVFRDGMVEVQDGSSQSVVPFFDIEPGMRVVDACAGAGGKSLHIADVLGNKGKVVSMDIHQWKLDQLKLRARRSRFSNIEWKLIESSKVIKRMHNSADRLLLDVPCSGLGVLRRNPDTKWKFTPESHEELKKTQAEILRNYSKIIKPGGIMVYATCSLLKSENEDQVRRFLQENPNFELKKQKKIYPIEPGFDGFYMAQMVRNS